MHQYSSNDRGSFLFPVLHISTFSPNRKKVLSYKNKLPSQKQYTRHCFGLTPSCQHAVVDKMVGIANKKILFSFCPHSLPHTPDETKKNIFCFTTKLKFTTFSFTHMMLSTRLILMVHRMHVTIEPCTGPPHQRVSVIQL